MTGSVAPTGRAIGNAIPVEIEAPGCHRLLSRKILLLKGMKTDTMLKSSVLQCVTAMATVVASSLLAAAEPATPRPAAA
jgi:hypothetical protein